MQVVIYKMVGMVKNTIDFYLKKYFAEVEVDYLKSIDIKKAKKTKFKWKMKD